MNFFHAIILGIVQGITEYLPISSTGHLIITSNLLNLEGRSVKVFEIVIQFGSILAVLGLYKDRVLQMLNGLFGKNSSGLKLLINLFLSMFPAGIIAFLFNKQIKSYLFNVNTVAGALAIGGILMIFADRMFRKNEEASINIDNISWKQALIIGFAQCFALFPGTSRSMVTILGGLCVGMNRKSAAEYSFLLALPTLGMACMYEGYKGGTTFIQEIGMIEIAAGIVVSGVVAAFSIKFLVSWLTKHGLAPFGFYRIIAAAFILIFSDLFKPY